MIKLTALHYKIKTASLEKAHGIQNHYDYLNSEWEKEAETSRSLGTPLPDKPFLEPFEFEEEDYDIKKVDVLIKKKSIISFKEHPKGYTDVVFSNGLEYSVAESISEIETILNNCKTE